MSRFTYWVMAAAAGLVVANNYYNQPLLVEIARSFGAAEREAGVVAIITQVGYAIGLLCFVPLGDKIELRKLICIMLCFAAGSLVSTALAPSLPCLIATSFLIGFTSIVPQLLTPFAALLAGPGGRGKAVGTVMFGLLCGILLSRTVAGFVGAHWGWRSMYWIGAAVMIALIALLYRLLPRSEPKFTGSYAELMQSLWRLVREQPVLRETSLIGALQFAAFSAFWTTLVFYLYSLPAHYGSEVAGLFGLVGVVGAGASPYAGRLTDRMNPRTPVLISGIILAAAYLIFALPAYSPAYSLTALIVGVILLDLGMQSGHVSNMTRNMNLKADSISRANTIYMCLRFAGGALGSTLGNYAWSAWGWPGVCAAGIVLSLLAVLVQFVAARRQ